MSLETEIRRIIEETFAELNRPDLIRTPLVAFASAQDPKYQELKTLVGPWHQLPTDFLPDAQTVISYFIPFTKEVALAPKNEPDGSPIWSEAYILINQHFHVVNQAVQDYLESQGYSAAQIRPAKAYDPETFRAPWSHRSTAVIAGLAAFGANNLAITDKGSGGRFCSLITSAKLEPTRSAPKKRCPYFINGGCGLCLKACPAGALDGGITNKAACQAELNKNPERLQKKNARYIADICGKCLSVCPLVYIE
ncbi:MAG: epoxyqueuosine reductase [Oscillospiraceae bacterium]|nr:epoxyqueuosine reductase [Oscillospiraceae bacterium]